jgi:hypothetical protein
MLPVPSFREKFGGIYKDMLSAKCGKLISAIRSQVQGISNSRTELQDILKGSKTGPVRKIGKTSSIDQTSLMMSNIPDAHLEEEFKGIENIEVSENEKIYRKEGVDEVEKGKYLRGSSENLKGGKGISLFKPGRETPNIQIISEGLGRIEKENTEGTQHTHEQALIEGEMKLTLRKRDSTGSYSSQTSDSEIDTEREKNKNVNLNLNKSLLVDDPANKRSMSFSISPSKKNTSAKPSPNISHLYSEESKKKTRKSVMVTRASLMASRLNSSGKGRDHFSQFMSDIQTAVLFFFFDLFRKTKNQIDVIYVLIVESKKESFIN